jgi:hypothetical protein
MKLLIQLKHMRIHKVMRFHFMMTFGSEIEKTSRAAQKR